MKRWLGTAAVAALCAFASPVLAQSQLENATPNAKPSGATPSVGAQLKDDQAQIQKDKSAISQDQMSGSSAAEDKEKLNQDVQQQKDDRQSGGEKSGSGGAAK